MDKRLKAAIDQLDILSVKRYISDKVPLYNISLSYVIETFGPANEEILWGYESREGDLELLRDIDRRKAVIVSTLLDHDVTFDDDCLHHCYTFRCPRTAKVLLANGINPNRLSCGTESALQLLRTGRDVVGFNDASEILLKEMERALLDYGAVEFEKRECLNLDKRPLMVVMMGLQGSGKTTFYKRRYGKFEHISMDLLKTRKRVGSALQKCIDKHLDCVIDNTNPTKTDRARYIVPGKNCGFRVIGYFMQSKLSECLVRNEKRERQVPKKGILATYNKIEMPSLQEGFDELNFVSIENGGFKISKWIENEI